MIMPRHLSLSLLLVAIAATCLPACHSPSTTPHQPTVTRSNQESVQDIAARIQNAKNPLAEADALKRLHSYAAEHRYTYTVQSFQAGSDRPLESAAATPGIVRTHVTVYRANQPIHDFWFTPKDNRNLQLISASG